MSAPSAKELSGAFPKLTSEKAEELAKRLREACDSDEDDAIDDALEAANDALGACDSARYVKTSESARERNASRVMVDRWAVADERPASIASPARRQERII